MANIIWAYQGIKQIKKFLFKIGQILRSLYAAYISTSWCNSMRFLKFLPMFLNIQIKFIFKRHRLIGYNKYMNMNRNMWRMNRVKRRIPHPNPYFFYILNNKYLGIVLFNVFSKISLFFHIIFVHVLRAEQIWKKKVFSNSKSE